MIVLVVSSVSLNMNFEGFKGETGFHFEPHPQEDMVEKFLGIRPGFEEIPSLAEKLIQQLVCMWAPLFVDSEFLPMSMQIGL